MHTKETITPGDGTAAQSAKVRGAVETIGHHGTLEAVLTRVDGTKEYFTGINARVNVGAAAQFAAVFSGTQPAQFNYVSVNRHRFHGAGVQPTLSH